ncbi:MAG: flagellar basal body-associated FliL family protein, partial [Rhodospirillales bacterium]|nr:flagellar basal body-associated FliL family protein [Rhodospirillales bacterium]
PNKWIKPLLFSIILVAVAAASGGSVYFFFLPDKTEIKDETKKEPEVDKKKGIAGFFSEEKTFYSTLPDVSADLVTGKCKSPSVRIQITLELPERGDLGSLGKMTPAALDSIQLYLRNKTREELSGAKGAEQTRKDLLAVLRKRLAPIEIKGILFKDFMLR